MNRLTTCDGLSARRRIVGTFGSDANGWYDGLHKGLCAALVWATAALGVSCQQHVAADYAAIAATADTVGVPKQSTTYRGPAWNGPVYNASSAFGDSAQYPIFFHRTDDLRQRTLGPVRFRQHMNMDSLRRPSKPAGSHPVDRG